MEGLIVPSPSEVIVRKSADHHPSVWGDYFIVHGDSSPNQTQESDASMKARVEELKERVKSMFKDASDVLQTMNLIDSIQLLGLDYHFDKEISEGLSRIHDADINNHGLYEIALRFRLLRQQGYHVSPDVFNKFKDEEGRFMSSLKRDAKGLLSLYNAAYLGTNGETILDEAISFARSQLTCVLSDLQPSLATQVVLALETPLCRRTRRLMARSYISIYQEQATQNDAILELAKLDFNLLQSLHREELKDISIWWNDLASSKNLSFARDRIVECYFWILGVYFEPHYSRARLITTKVIALASILDDTYDIYSTPEESRLLTEAIQRWDADAVHQLPEYLKPFSLKLINTFEEFRTLLPPEEKYRIYYLKEVMKDLTRAYFVESTWSVQHYVPTLEEHLHVSLVTAAYRMLKCASFVGMGEVATEEAFEWITSFPRIVKASSIIGRVMNDIASHEVACEKLQGLVEDAWKDINEECLNPTTFPMPLLERIVNLSRMADNTYNKHIDEYTHSSTRMKDNISLLLVHPVPI